MAEVGKNKRDGTVRFAAGAIASGLGIAFYGLALPVGVITTGAGIFSMADGMALQAVSKNKESRLYKLGLTLRFAGSCGVMFGVGCITSPVSGAAYAIVSNANDFDPSEFQSI